MNRTVPDVIAPGPDGALWFTQGSIGQVGRLRIKQPRPHGATATRLDAGVESTAIVRK